MKKRVYRYKLVILAIAVTILAVGVITIKPDALVGVRESGAAPGMRTATETAHGIDYSVVHLDGKTGALVNVDTSTNGLKGFIDGNRRIAAEMAYGDADEIDASISFAYPLSGEELQEFLDTYNVQLERYLLRATTDTGERITIFGQPGASELLPSKELGTTIEALPGDEAVRVHGVITIYGSWPGSATGKVVNDSRVVLVDLSAVYIAELLAKNASESGEMPEIVVEQPLELYWFLEEAGIVSVP